MPNDFIITGDGPELAGEEAGEGPAVVLCHGLTATRRYVVMGSRFLERGGHRVISYDARAHGSSAIAATPVSYAALSDDLLRVLDDRGVETAVLAGVSMGAHTILRFALEHPGRVRGLVVITPAYSGPTRDLSRWDALAAGLRDGGIEGFLTAYDLAAVDAGLRDTVATVIRQRMARHRDLSAVARALSEIPRSIPFDAISDLGAIRAPSAVVASADGPDPEHPQAVAEAYAEAIPESQIIRDTPGASPVAWRGSQISRVIADVVARSGPGPHPG